MSADNNDPAPQLPATQPPPPLPVNPRWLNPLGVAALLLVIIFAALIIHNESRERSALDLVPVDAVYYTLNPLVDFVPSPTAAVQFTDAGAVTTPAFIQHSLDGWLQYVFGELPPELAQAFRQSVVRCGFVRSPGLLRGSSGSVYLAQCGSAWDVKTLFAAPEFHREPLTLTNFSDGYQFTAPNGNTLFFAVLKPYAVFAENLHGLQKTIDCWRQVAPSVGQAIAADGAAFTYERNRRAEMFVRTANLTNVDECVLTEIKYDGDYFIAQGQRFSLPRAWTNFQPAPYSFWRELVISIFKVIGWLIALAIILPALFLLTVILVAVWFHFTSKWRGINAPDVAPELPPLSPELTEDLGAAAPETK